MTVYQIPQRPEDLEGMPDPTREDDGKTLYYDWESNSFRFKDKEGPPRRDGNAIAAFNAGVTRLRDMTDVSGTLDASSDGYGYLYNFATDTYILSEISTSSTIAGATDFTDTTGPATDGYSITWDNATSKFILTEITGGGGTPGGSDTQVQYNDGGAFGGDAGLTYNETDNELTVSGGIITDSIRPSADGATAIQVQDSLGNSIIDVDTTNERLIFNASSVTSYLMNLRPTGADGFFSFRNASNALMATMTYGSGGVQFASQGTFGFEFRANSSQPFTVRTVSASSYRVLNSGGYAVYRVADAGLSEFTKPDSATGTVVDVMDVKSVSTGTAGTGFGAAIHVKMESSTTDNRSAGRLIWEWDNGTDATRASIGKLTSYYITTERESIAWGSDSSESLLSFHGSTPAVQPDITGSRAGNAALADLLTKLATIGLITDSTT